MLPQKSYRDHIMLKKLTILSVLAVVLCVNTATAHAEPKPWIWSWWESHWNGLDFKPYTEDAKHTHLSQWNKQPWQPSDWSAQRGNGVNVIKGFYRSGVFRDQYIKDDMPVLEIGSAFYSLSGQDRRRVTAMVDDVYQVTSSRVNGSYMIVDGRSKKPVGVYTRYGLQMQ